MIKSSFAFLNESDIPPGGLTSLASHQCGVVKLIMLLLMLNCALHDR